MNENKEMNPLIVSIIIPALNEENAIKDCLNSICNLEYPKELVEVILIDNGSVDKTVDYAKNFIGRLKIQIEILRNVNISGLRNFGSKIANGNILAFLDADCTVSKKWIESAIKYFDDDTIGAVGCSHVIPEISSWVAKAWFVNIEKKRVVGEVSHLPSGNLFIKKKYFEKIGRFDEALKTNEDYELCLRLRSAGFRIFSDPTIKAFHLGVPQTLREFFEQQRWHGTHVAKVFIKNFRGIKSVRDLNAFKAFFYGCYYLIVYIWLLLDMIAFILSQRYILILLPIIALILPAFILGVKTTCDCRTNIVKAIQLIFLFFIYGSARAVSMIAAFWLH